MADSKKYDGSQWEHSLRKLTTATEAVENPLYSDGTAITSYTISGNMSQTGTPTPSNPVDVNGVGVRTENLWDGAIGLDNTRINLTEGTTVADPNYALSDYIPVSASTSYVYSFRHNQYEPNRTSFTVSFYKSNKQPVQEIVLQYINDEGAIAIPFTTPANTAYIRINWKKPYDDMLMLSLGSTAKPYEPWGYKIPISSANITTNIYLGEVQTTRKIGKINLSEVSWTKVGSILGLWRTVDIPNVKYVSVNTELGAGIAEKYTIHTGTGMAISSNCIAIDVSQVSVNTGSNTETPTGMFWYALATEETGIVNEPLMKIGTYADTLSNAASIPTTEGANSITVDTTVQPSEFTATWTGWHDASVKEKSENLFDTFDIVGQVPSISNGQLINYNGSTTSLIPIISGDITVTKPPTALLYLLLYAADMSYIGYVQNSTDTNFYGSSVTGYENARFARLRIDRTTGLDDIQIMLNTGSTALPYEPYWK